MTYFDGFLIAVPKDNRDKFIAHANTGDSVFMDLGALRVVECWGDDVPDGKTTDLRRAVQAEADEEVVFSWIEWPDKATRDEAFAKMTEWMEDPAKADPRMDPEKNPMPFDGTRLIYGGFRSIGESGAGGDAGYVDGVVCPVQSASEDAYADWCSTVGEAFVEHGALRVVDTLGDDVPDGKQTDFRRAVKAEDGETVGFGWVEWQSKAARDTAWEKLMQDERMTQHGDTGMDGKRMIFGGFTPIVELKGE